MTRRERTVVPGAHRLEHVDDLGAAHLADHETIGPHAQRVAQQLADRHAARTFAVRGMGLQPHDVIGLELELGGVLDRDDTLVRPEPTGRARSAAWSCPSLLRP